LGLDTDNGGEFINEVMVAYCKQEQLTFTRGRPECSNDNCHVEQKNGAVVRHAAGHVRLVGEVAYQQLGEVYRALRLCVNCFQPSLKLQSKQVEGEKERRVYDEARTPLQRLLLSGILAEQRQQELREAAQTLDPLRLVHHLEELQHALWQYANDAPGASLMRFSLDACSSTSVSEGEQATKPVLLPQEPPKDADTWDWSHSMRDPFLGEWERIHAFVRANPTCSSGDILQEWQRRYPGRFVHAHLGTLQRGLREIRVHLLETRAEPWPSEVIQGCLPAPFPWLSKLTEEHPHPGSVPPSSYSPAGAFSQEPEAGWPSTHQAAIGDEDVPFPHPPTDAGSNDPLCPDEVRGQEPLVALPHSGSHQAGSLSAVGLTIEQAMSAYLQDQHAQKREPKTLEWHQTALNQLQHYLTWRHLSLLSSLTTIEIQGWLTFLRVESLATGTFRTNNTISTYARSVHAFCHWLVRQGYVEQTPFASVRMPKTTSRRLHLVEQGIFDRLLHASRALGTKRKVVDHATARNQALLLVLWETGLLVSEVCALDLGDVDLPQSTLHIQGTGSRGRSLPLTPRAQRALIVYLEQYRLRAGKQGTHDPLFLSEQRGRLTPNALTLLFHRLNRRAGLRDNHIIPSMLRDTFAIRFLQAEGQPKALQRLLGLVESTPIKHYQDAARSLPHGFPTPEVPPTQES
jgi:site-specific recombinase XerD